MNNLKVQVTVSSLSSLTSVGPNQYQVVAKFFTTAGLPLGNPNINNSSTLIITTTSTTFDVNVPVVDADWTINDVVIKIYSNNDTNCCFAVGEFDLVNEQSNTPGENTLELSVYFSE